MFDICASNQSSTLLFNSTILDVPECYQDSFIIWIPTFFLFFIAPFYIFSLEADKNIGHTWLNILKTTLSTILVLLCLGDVFVNFYEYYNGLTNSKLHIMAPCILFIAMVATLCLIQLGRCRGAYISGFLFIFWLLLFLAFVIFVQSRIRILVIQLNNQENNNIVTYHTVHSIICLILVFMQLILAGFFVDGRQSIHTKDATELEDCPEDTANFLSRLTFWWFTPLIITGFKKSLERNDLWNLWYKNRTKNVMPRFEKYWAKELARHYNSHNDKVYMDVASGNPSNAEMKVLLDPQKTPVNPILIKKAKTYQPSLWKALTRSFGLTFIYGSFFKLIHDILMFASPMILKYIIRFINDPTSPDWVGYIYALMIFLVAFVQSMVLHQYFHICMVVGMNVRTTLVGTIYKKSLRLSNEARKKSTVGEIVNLMSTDAQRFMELTTYLNMLWSAPFQMCLSLYFLWMILGPSVLAGVGVMILLIPINVLIAKKSKVLQTIQMKHKDARIKLMSEIFNGIKVLKLYAWEPSFEKKVLEIRNKELNVLKKASYLGAVSSFVWNCSPFLVSLATFSVYVLSSAENLLDAEKAFVSLALFNILRFPLSMLPMLIANMVQTSVSVKRLETFLISEDLDENSVLRTNQSTDEEVVVINRGKFTWEKSEDGKSTLQDINLSVKKGKLIGIVGSVGAGKSTLISAILGETDRLEGNVTINGSVAYVAQQAWMQNASVENNILFGKVMDRQLYEKVIDACALKPDLELFVAGDETEIGEKGINLSGGQKQRISLARAVYMNADIYLLDDTLSAVDAHVGKHIFNNVLGPNGLLKEKTRIFVTHGIIHLKNFDEIIVMEGGRISETGTYNQLLMRKGSFAEFLRSHILTENSEDMLNQDEDELELTKEILTQIGSGSADSAIQEKLQRLYSELSNESPKSLKKNFIFDLDKSDELIKRRDSKSSQHSKTSHKSGKDLHQEKSSLIQYNDRKKIVQDEKMETGNVKLSVFLEYLKSIGLFIVITIVFLYIVNIVLSTLANFWLSDWSTENSNLESNKTQPTYSTNLRLSIYAMFGLGQSITVLIGAFILARGALRASSNLHHRILDNGLKSPMSFFDSTPVGRIINRFSKDIEVIDTLVPLNLDVWTKCTLTVFGTLFVISYSTPYFLVVIVPLSLIYYFVQRVYVKTSRQLKRLESVSRSPIFSHFGETIQGASTIRAYQQEARFIRESEIRVDENLFAYYPSIASNRWLAVRLEFVGNCIVFFSALFAVAGRYHLSAGIVGLSISYALNITQTLNWMVRMTSEVETNIVAVERVKEYSETPTEAKWIVDTMRPPPNWPQHGHIQINDFSLTYRKELDPVLKKITCEIQPGERIGIVGRTGAGKSSLTLGLFRIVEGCGGSIIIDDVVISEIGLHDLRSKLTIIPQDPVLFSGTLRMNLDPFDYYKDEEIWLALRYAHLEKFVISLPQNLTYECGEGGVNLSVGQRQLLCLARALLRKTRILVLDEATAAVDLETDDLIQATIREQFNDCTIVTIAHRINTIMDYNKILVLDNGMLKEFDSPIALLAQQSSIFYSLCNEAGLVE